MAKKSKSIRDHLMFPILVIMLLQAVLFLSTVLYGEVAKSLKSNSVSILNENTRNGKLFLEKEIVHRWINEVENTGALSDEIEKLLKSKGNSAEDIQTDSELNKDIISNIMPHIIDLLHRSYATGAFVVLNGPSAENSADTTKAGAYIRDLDISNYAQDNSDLLLERGLPSLAKTYGIALDSFWELGFNLEEESTQTDFFFKPFKTASINHAKCGEEKNYGYMSGPFALNDLDTMVITYTVPIIVNGSDIIGVVGLDMTVSQVQAFISTDKKEYNDFSFSLLGVRNAGEHNVGRLVSTGTLFERYFGQQDILSMEYDKEYNIYYLESLDGTKWFASAQQLDIYGNNTPFENEEWVYLKLVEERTVFSFYDKIKYMMVVSLLLPLIFSGVCVVISGRVLTDPIKKLVDEIKREKNPEQLILKRVNIDEIDQLVDAIEELSKDVAENSSKISRILDNANVPIGVFEYKEKQQSVFCSKSLFDMLGMSEVEGSYIYMDIQAFGELMEKLRCKSVEKDVFYIEQPSSKWLKLVTVKQGDGYLGVLSDITADMLERKKLEKERDYDLLTNLFNRRAFKEQTLAAMEHGTSAAAMIMWDLDNLKYINDTYGHDEGDRYIVLFAMELKKLEESGALVSRYAGDEFLTFFYNGGSREYIRAVLATFMDSLKNCTMEMTGGYKIPLRVSAGISWYPDDSIRYDILVSYADFAMYTAKHSVKGILLEFNRESYDENSYMLAGKEELNRIFEEKRIKFAYQPIVDRKGKVYGYELLMRPKMEKLKGINEVLTLAKAQAKLSQMESLTWNAGLESAVAMLESGRIGQDDYIFINSISSVSLTDLELELIEQRYGELLNRVVIELTESEQMQERCLQQKMAAAGRWNAQIAIDDYGSGYNSEGLLLEIRPDIVKLDMSLVRNIHSDQNRQMLVKNMVDYARNSGIRVLAEGVETYEELRILMSFQVDLFQGYYIGRPDEEVRPLDPYIIERICSLEEI